ncbi:MAG: type II secretion system GspH family protein, partial [Spirochaetes bacterium]|nr:type II secretion system GspH family protein [Spirochaetota bacterium]
MSGHSRSAYTLSAFTLVEIMVVVTIIGVLASLALPAFARVQQATRITQVVNDIQLYERAIQQYNLELAEWPSNQRWREDYPGGMEAYLPTEFAKNSPLQGEWRLRVTNRRREDRTRVWLEIRSRGRNNRIVATNYELTEIDKAIDDGDTSTGNFRVINR